MRKLLLLLIFFAPLSVAAQVVVKGVVTSSDGSGPVIGATVHIKGSGSGVAVDTQGKYSISVPGPGSTLVYSSLGYFSQEIYVGGREIIDVVLQVDNQMLEEIVVMGYTSKSKNEITSAVAVVSSEKLKDVTAPNIGDMLQGKVAGLSVVKGSGAPGANPSIRIRGLSSMSAPQEPLYVVDGIIGGIFDPNDIETVTVLKDAGATGMYGAQANGGVIVVTTRKAKGNKLTVDFKANAGITTPDFSRNKKMNSAQLYNYYREYFRDPNTYLIDDVAFNKAIPRSVLDTDTDWRSLVFNKGFIQDYHVSLAGRSEKHSFYNGIAYYDEKGVLKNTGYRHINLRSNNTFNLTPWLSITSNVNIYASSQNAADTNLMVYVEWAIPWDSPFDSQGNLRKFSQSKGIWMRDKVNPLLAFEDNRLNNNAKMFRLDYDFVLNAKIFPWLSFTTQNRVGGSTYKSHYHRTVEIEYMHGGDLLEESQSFGYGFISTNMLKAEKSFGNHSVSGLVGYEAQMGCGEDLYASGQGLPYHLYVLDVTSSTPVVGGSKSKAGMQSLIAQANYNYLMKYFLVGSFRMDQSSTFNKDNRTAYFPSASASWVVSNEPWMKASKVISNLKLKASWGLTGMKDIGASKYLDSFAYSTHYMNNSAAVPIQMANPNLKWEQTSQNNIGVELGLYNRINLDLNWYYNNTDNLLVYRDLPPSGGFSSQWQNLGSVINTGLEFSLNVVPILTGDFRWDIDFSLAYNKNRLYGFGGTKIFKSTYEGIRQIYEDGEELYTWYLKEYSGIDPATGRQQFVDENGKLTYDYASARYVKAGSALSPWQGGFSTSFTYKNVTLSATGSFVWGNKLYGRRRASSLATFVDNSLLPSSEDKIWRKPGDIATIGLPAYASATLYHTGFLVDGDFFKLRNVSVRYTFPRLLNSGGKLSLGLSCDNLFTLCKVWGGDPEASIGLDNSIPGRINDLESRYPNKRQYLFQVNLTF